MFKANLPGRPFQHRRTPESTWVFQHRYACYGLPLMEQDQALYLRLSDDFGGTRFGPFEGVEVSLGSDESNDITIPENFGVTPDHAKVIVQDGRGILVTPASQTASVYVWKGRASKPNQIATPTAVRHGDSFALVSAHGPRFFIEIDLLPDDVLSKRKGMRGQERLNKGALKKEGLRQVILRAMTTGWGQRISKAWWFVRSGEIFLPRNIFLIGAIGGGWVMGTLAMCNKADAQNELAEIETQLEIEKDRTGNTDVISLGKQLARVTGVQSFETLLMQEKALAGKIREKAKRIYARKLTHSWLTDVQKNGNSRLRSFQSTHKSIQDWSKIDSATRKILPWVGVTKLLFRDAEDQSWWALNSDSRGDKVCHRGPLAMTWTQATQLGMDTNLDVFAEEKPQEGEETIKALKKSAKRALNFDRTTITDDLSLVTRLPEGSDDSFCIVVKGSESRDSLSKLEQALRPGKKGLPENERETYSLTAATLMKFFAADTRGADFTKTAAADFSNSLATGLSMLEEEASDWVVERTAETIAAAAVLPCIRRVEFQDDELPQNFSEGGYQPIDCILLNYVVEYGDITLKED